MLSRQTRRIHTVHLCLPSSVCGKSIISIHWFFYGHLPLSLSSYYYIALLYKFSFDLSHHVFFFVVLSSRAQHHQLFWECMSIGIFSIDPNIQTLYQWYIRLFLLMVQLLRMQQKEVQKSSWAGDGFNCFHIQLFFVIILEIFIYKEELWCGILSFSLCEVSGRPIMYALSESDSSASSLSQYFLFL